MSRVKRWAEREYSAKQRFLALIPQALVFVIIIPFLIIMGSIFLDQWLALPRIYHGLINLPVGIVFIVIGSLCAFWTVRVQFMIGKGTPVPIIPTQKLIILGPYKYCKNPMALGTFIAYIGVGICTGFFSSTALVFLFIVFLVTYIKLIEEKELIERFGSEYLEYQQNIPFLIPRIRKGSPTRT
jgi:protein-S-isoprenylcysteine O-methyltransferase Ste14